MEHLPMLTGTGPAPEEAGHSVKHVCVLLTPTHQAATVMSSCGKPRAEDAVHKARHLELGSSDMMTSQPTDSERPGASGWTHADAPLAAPAAQGLATE